MNRRRPVRSDGTRGGPELKIEGGIIRPRPEKAPHRWARLHEADGWVLKQVDAVHDLVREVPVTGALCFVEADWPLIVASSQPAVFTPPGRSG